MRYIALIGVNVWPGMIRSIVTNKKNSMRTFSNRQVSVTQIKPLKFKFFKKIDRRAFYSTFRK